MSEGFARLMRVGLDDHGPRRRYYSPVLAMTGSPVEQPRAEAMRSECCFDKHWTWLGPFDRGCLDAPLWIPTGGERAMDSGPLRLGVCTQPRAYEVVDDDDIPW